jgi:hypothetical protein
MGLVAQAQKDEWLSDEEWQRQLPDWFLRSFEGHTVEQIAASTLLWDFGSWLDAMRRPGWEWWSSAAGEQTGIVRCTAQEYPFAIEPLIYLIRSAGAPHVQFDES